MAAFHLVVLVNEGAGSVDDDGGDAQLAEIVDAFEAADPAVKVRAAFVAPGSLPRAIREAWRDDSPDAVVVAGGDGTVSCAAQEAAGTEVVLGVLPLGTFNHFAKDLGVPTDLTGAAAALVSGSVRAVDVAEVNGQVFVNNSVLGIYPQMVAVRDRIRDERGWGKVRAVPVAAARVLRSFPVHRLDLSGTGGFSRRRVRTPMVFVGNGRYDNALGGAASRDDLDDGLLGVSIARVVSRWGLVTTVARALLSGMAKARDLDQVELAELTIAGRVRHLRVALDGEIRWLEAPLRYRIRPRALQVLAPVRS